MLLIIGSLFVVIIDASNGTFDFLLFDAIAHPAPFAVTDASVKI